MNAEIEHADELDEAPPSPQNGPSAPHDHDGEKKQVVRGARACMVCRTAKMRCLGGDDQASDLNPCNRCKKSGVECRFEKHRRGRKPGSRVSESNKLQRRHEKDHASSSRNDMRLEDASSSESGNLNRLPAPSYPPPPPSSYLPPLQAKAKQEGASEYMEDCSPTSPVRHHPSSSREYPGPPFAQPYQTDRYQTHVNTSQIPASSVATLAKQHPASASADDDENLFPSAILAKEKSRQSFMATVLGPSAAPAGKGKGKRPASKTPDPEPPEPIWNLPACFYPPKERLPDPVEVGLMTEAEAGVLLDQVFEFLNPFVNLLDPKLHTVGYLRKTSPFLFTVLMMAGCKFFKPDMFTPLQTMAYIFAVRALEDQWRSVEVVQAFCCLVYWKEPDDTRTWQFVGFACRLAVELGLNTVTRPLPNETVDAKRLRRNRERTYLVLFVHDRSLSMQTGRSWMLQEDDFIRASRTWHEAGDRPEDVIVAAFVQLRRLSAETSDVFHLRKDSRHNNSDVNYEVLLNGCNTKLTAWMEYWEDEMNKADGTEFHFCLLRFFRLHVRLFLNSLGLTKQTPNQTGSRDGSAFSIQALSLCYTSAKETLQIVAQFKTMGTLRFGQDVITVMSAYAAIFLLRLARRTAGHDISTGINTAEIRTLIEQSAGAFYEGAVGPKGIDSSSGAAHARFLWTLVTTDREDEARRRRSEPAAARDSRPGPQRLGRGPSRSAGSLSIATEREYSPGGHSTVSQSPISARTSSMRSPNGAFPPSGHGAQDGRPLSFSSSADPMYRVSSAASHPPLLPPSYHHGGPTNGEAMLNGNGGASYTGGNGQSHSQMEPHQQYHQQQPQSAVMYQHQSQQPLRVQYIPEQAYPQGSIEQQTQVMLQSVPANPIVDHQYTQHMYEQLGMQGAHLHDSAVPYIAPATHPHLPSVGEQQLFGDPY